MNSKLSNGEKTNIIESLIRYINYNIKYSKSQDIQRKKFSRTSQEIWESKVSSGCTDFSTVFATLARQLEIPTTLLHTTEYNWVQNLQQNKKFKMFKGHTFCECFFENKWILVDPTAQRIIYDYNPEKIELDYKLGNDNVFVTYFRGLDLKQKMTTRQHNELMKQECLKL